MRLPSRLAVAVAAIALPVAAVTAPSASASAAPGRAAVHAKVADAKVADAKVAEAKVAEAKVAEAKVSNAKVVDCQGGPAEVKPRTLLYACGDASTVAIKLHWTNWGARRAHATGYLAVNDCTPNCATGHFHDFEAALTLTRLHTFADGRSRYRYVTIRSLAPGRGFGVLRASLPG